MAEAVEEINDDRQSKKLKSVPSVALSYVRFCNESERNVDLIWLDFNGKGVKYRTLLRREAYRVNTYVGHPWVAQGTVSRANMLIDGKDVFLPVAPRTFENGLVDRTAVDVIISIPVYSLKECCLQALRPWLQGVDVTLLEIPVMLQEELANEARGTPVDRIYVAQ